ncbi:MAG: amidohydrolase family protein [Chitinophagales bacterium]
MRLLLFGLIIFIFSIFSTAQVTTFPENGAPDQRPEYYAVKASNIQIAPDRKVEDAWLLFRKGKVEKIVSGSDLPKAAVQIDLGEYFIYPSFIDAYSNYGLPEPEKKKGEWKGPQFVSEKDGAFAWNEALKPETAADKLFKYKDKEAEKYRKAGFGTAISHVHDGIARGTGSAVLLSEDQEHNLILKEKAAAFYSFSKGTSPQDYPGSLMGSIALLRQTYLDGQWYAARKNDEVNLSLRAWNENLKLPAVFEAGDVLNVLRADKVGDEFGVQYIIKEDGTAYQKLDEIKASGASLIVPLDFPEPYDVSDPFDAINVSLQEMKHWELAPSNAKFLDEKGIPFVFTAEGLKDKNEFLQRVKKAVKAGLSETAALKAMTTLPAELFGIDQKTGTLETGKLANFIVTDKPLFHKDSRIIQNWVNGKQYIIEEANEAIQFGKYQLNIDEDIEYTLKISGTPFKIKAKLQIDDSTKADVKVTLSKSLISLEFSDEERYQLSGSISGEKWKGKGQFANGEWFNWEAVKTDSLSKEDKEEEKPESEIFTTEKIYYPFLAYGSNEQPETEELIVKNATVWTNESDGILENADVWIKKGKIEKVGSNLAANGIKTIDANGKHLTSGIIDEHSHIAISKGVNEWTQASSAEVRIGDVVNSEDVNIYRQLSGGVTAAQLLHGSANPIGGQSALIKMRWGKNPEAMKIEGADGFIKFALGENVKQSNWGEKNTVRFPQTRMGVEQVFVDYFSRAKAYEQKQKEYQNLSNKERRNTEAPRKDLDLEAVLEVVNGERFVTCHSYVQSEINMLMKVAEDFGFRINTFTHVLEGYKIADKLKAHGAAASTFSDWWAYKYEVIDAIPQNASILNEQGVLTSINSDDAEMGRRLNQEAAKSIKYGGMSREDTWKMITLNPAKMLHLDHRMGSIKAGKDADLVLWSGDPLSIYSKVEKTIIDGICYYDFETDKEKREAIKQERARLIQKMLDEKSNGKKTQKPVKKEDKIYHCLSIDEFETHDH